MTSPLHRLLQNQLTGINATEMIEIIRTKPEKFFKKERLLQHRFALLHSVNRIFTINQTVNHETSVHFGTFNSYVARHTRRTGVPVH
jgi:hypothetical protein